MQDFRAGLESENEISDLDDQLKKLSTAQDAEEDDSFGMYSCNRITKTAIQISQMKFPDKIEMI